MILDPVSWWQAYAEWYAQPWPLSAEIALLHRALERLGRMAATAFPTFCAATLSLQRATERVTEAIA